MKVLCLKTQKFTRIGFVFFFDNELLSIELDKKIVKNSNKEIKKKMKEDKVPLLQRGVKKEQAWEEYGESLAVLPKEDIIFQHSEHTVIEYNKIVKFKLTPFRRNVRSGTDNTDVQDYLGEISVKDGVQKIWYNHRYQKDDVKYQAAKKVKVQLSL